MKCFLYHSVNCVIKYKTCLQEKTDSSSWKSSPVCDTTTWKPSKFTVPVCILSPLQRWANQYLKYQYNQVLFWVLILASIREIQTKLICLISSVFLSTKTGKTPANKMLLSSSEKCEVRSHFSLLLLLLLVSLEGTQTCHRQLTTHTASFNNNLWFWYYFIPTKPIPKTKTN